MRDTSKKVTLDDLSAELQLSKYSVSRALSGKGGVSPQTRDAVIEVATRLGYDHPALRRGERVLQDAQILLVIPRTDAADESFWLEVMSGAESEAARLGCVLVTSLAAENGHADAHLGKAQGILLAGRRSRGLLEGYLQTRLPVALIGYPEPGETFDAVHTDNWEAGYLAGAHLRELGHRNIAFVTAAPDEMSRRERLRGCRDALGGSQAQVTLVAFDPAEGTERFVERIRQDQPMPTAIFCANDVPGLQVIWALHQAGLRVPQDLSVVNSSAPSSAMQFGPEITTVRVPMREIGEAAMAMLARRMLASGERAPRRLSLGVQLHIGGTTGPAQG